MTTSERMEDRAKRTTLWYDLVLDDERPLPEYLRERVPYHAKSQQVPVHRYTSREWHLLEREHLWRKVWQMACREEHIPEVGSYVRLRHRRRLLPHRAHPGGHQGVRQRLLAPRARAEGLRRTLQRVPLQLPRLHLATGRHAASHTGTGRVPRDRGRPRRVAPSGSQGRRVGRVRVHQSRSGRRIRSRTSSARCRSTSPGGTSSIATCRRTSPRRSAAIGRSPRKRSTRACTSAPPIPSRLPTSATPTPPSTSTETTRGRSARPARRSRTCRVDATETDILKRMLDVREGEDLPIPFSQRSTARDAMARAGRERWRQALGDEADDISDAELVDHWNYIVFPNFHPVGWLQPHHLSVPAEWRSARRIDLRGHVPDAVSGRTAANR